MFPTTQKEQFSRAVGHAIATLARCVMSVPAVDQDSIDVEFACTLKGRKWSSPQIQAQLKCTEIDAGGPKHLAYDLPLKNYDDLRSNSLIPRILIVAVVPPKVDLWHRWTADELVLSVRCHWMSLTALPAKSNTRKVAVHLPRSQRFDVQTLRHLMQTIADGGRP